MVLVIMFYWKNLDVISMTGVDDGRCLRWAFFMKSDFNNG
jgi:hypothetical protein